MKGWKRALVTGAAKGIGEALCKALIKQGVEVTAIDRNKIEWVGDVDNNLLNLMEINLLNSNSVNDVISSCNADDQFDLRIHNAGVSATGKFEDIDPIAYENLLRINLYAPIELNLAMLAAKLTAVQTNIVFISSLSHATGYPGAAVYGASKDAIAVYAKSIRKPFAKLGLYVTTVFPGPVRTEHAERHAPEGAKAETRMLPDVLAVKILQAAAKNQKVLYPGLVAKLTRVLGAIAPNMMTKLMRKIIYDKLDRSVW
jgi:short-subunit dehydrogenase